MMAMELVSAKLWNFSLFLLSFFLVLTLFPFQKGFPFVHLHCESVLLKDFFRQNLVRIKDILSELEKQVEPLEKQAQTAKEYLNLKEELKIYDIHLFLHSVLLTPNAQHLLHCSFRSHLVLRYL